MQKVMVLECPQPYGLGKMSAVLWLFFLTFNASMSAFSVVGIIVLAQRFVFTLVNSINCVMPLQ